MHPHIVPVHDSGRVGDLVYFVMPYLEGETLRECLDREGVLPVEDALRVLAELASALDYAHGRGVVHRDVKPSNVMLSEGGAMLADFGVAIALRESMTTRPMDPAFSVGTPEYVRVPSFTVSADGTRLHYARWTGLANLLAVDLWTSSGSDGRPRWLTTGTAERREPRIAPDGRNVAFARRDPDGWNLSVTDFDGNVRRLTHFDRNVTSPAWSPDGRRIAFGATGATERGVWTVGADGGAATRVGGDGYGGYEVVWLATGRILYQRSGDRSYGLLAPDSGEVGRIRAPAGVWIYGPRGSPDGRRVAFRGTGNGEGLWVVDLACATWTRLSERSFGPVAWALAGDTVYAIPAEGRSGGISGELFAIPSEGGPARSVARLPDGMTVNPWNVSFRRATGPSSARS